MGWFVALALCQAACDSSTPTQGESPAPFIESVSLGASAIALNVREERKLVATLRDERGRPVSGGVTVVWTSRDPARVSVGQTGSVRALALGAPTWIVATAGSAADSVRVTIVPRLRIDPQIFYLGIDSTVALTATLLDHFGAVLGPGAATWRSTNQSVATVEQSAGRVSGVSEGITTIVASLDGIETSHGIEVGHTQPVDGEWTGLVYNGRMRIAVHFGTVRHFRVLAGEFPPGGNLGCTLLIEVTGKFPIDNGSFSFALPFTSNVTARFLSSTALEVKLARMESTVSDHTCPAGVGISSGALPEVTVIAIR